MTREQGKFKFVPSVVKKKNFLYCGTSGRKNLAPGQEAKAKAVWSLCRLKGQGLGVGIHSKTGCWDSLRGLRKPQPDCMMMPW